MGGLAPQTGFLLYVIITVLASASCRSLLPRNCILLRCFTCRCLYLSMSASQILNVLCTSWFECLCVCCLDTLELCGRTNLDAESKSSMSIDRSSFGAQTFRSLSSSIAKQKRTADVSTSDGSVFFGCGCVRVPKRRQCLLLDVRVERESCLAVTA